MFFFSYRIRRRTTAELPVSVCRTNYIGKHRHLVLGNRLVRIELMTLWRRGAGFGHVFCANGRGDKKHWISLRGERCRNIYCRCQWNFLLLLLSNEGIEFLRPLERGILSATLFVGTRRRRRRFNVVRNQFSAKRFVVFDLLNWAQFW